LCFKYYRYFSSNQPHIYFELGCFKIDQINPDQYICTAVQSLQQPEMLSDREIDFLGYEFIQEAHKKYNSTYNSTFRSLLCAAVEFLEEGEEAGEGESRKLALEQVCETQRHELSNNEMIPLVEVDKLHSIRRLMDGCTRPALVDRCARIMSSTLETVADASEFPYVIELFPMLAQHNCLSVHRVKFMEKFGSFIPKETVDGWVMELNGELYPKIQFETQSRLLNHLEWLVLKNKKRAALHPLMALAKKTLRTRIVRLVYHHHAQRKDEPTNFSQQEILAMFRKRLVRKVFVEVAHYDKEEVAKVFLEATKHL